MMFSDSNRIGVRVLSTAHSRALGSVRAAWPGKLDRREELVLSQRLTLNLLDAHDEGERDPDELRRAALRGVLTTGPRN